MTVTTLQLPERGAEREVRASSQDTLPVATPPFRPTGQVAEAGGSIGGDVGSVKRSVGSTPA